MSTSALWFDYNNDGKLDLYVSVWEDYSTGERNIRNRMYEYAGDGLFINVSAVSGLDDDGKTWMTIAFDIDNDGWLDLYLANDFGANKLYINNRDNTFEDMGRHPSAG